MNFERCLLYPSLCNNIISLGQIFEEGHKIEINGEFLWIRGRKKGVVDESQAIHEQAIQGHYVHN